MSRQFNAFLNKEHFKLFKLTTKEIPLTLIGIYVIPKMCSQNNIVASASVHFIKLQNT